jgi:hypothetical protein
MDLAVHRQRDVNAAPAQHLPGALVERAPGRRRPQARHDPLPLRALHREGGRCRFCARRRARLLPRRGARALPHPLARLSPLGGRIADRTDPRRRADGRRLAQPEAARTPSRLGRRRGDRRLSDLLPRHDQHDSRTELRRPPRARADALVCGRKLAHPLEAPLPAALPYIFAALKISATASVVGAIIGELPSSIQDGLGGQIINYSQYYTTQPTGLWATNVIAAALGISFFVIILIAEKLVVRRAPENFA